VGYALALYHYARFEYDAALRELFALRARQPHNAEVIGLIGFVRRRQGRFDDAIASLEQATRLGPRSAAWWYNLGETYWLVRDYAAAERVLDRAFELAPGSETPHVYRIRTRVCRTGRTNQARGALADAERFGSASHLRIVHESVWLEVLDRRPGCSPCSAVTQSSISRPAGDQTTISRGN
jgi:predicted Zn-dependent protease